MPIRVGNVSATFNVGSTLGQRAYQGGTLVWSRQAAHALQPYFDSGTIAIYLDTDGATLNGSGPLTGVTNRGAGGANFNAAVTGNPIPLSGNAMQMSASTGNLIMANPASIDGVRLMWACSTESLASSMRFMGSPNDEVRLGAIQTGTPNSAFLQFWSNRSGSGMAIQPTPRIALPASGMHTFESEMNIAGQSLTAWLDGTQVATTNSVPFTAFTVDRLGQGQGSSNQYIGRMGAMTGVIMGRTDSDAAIAAVRAYWNRRFAPQTTIKLDDPAAIIAMTASNRTATSMNLAANASGRSTIAWNVNLPVGSVIRARIANTGAAGNIFLRCGPNPGLGPNLGEMDLIQSIPPGQTTPIAATITAAQAAFAWLGFLINSDTGTATITEFSVTAP